jgi:hypothetical protein
MPNAQQRWGCKGLGGIPSGLGVFHKTSPNWLRDTATQIDVMAAIVIFQNSKN